MTLQTMRSLTQNKIHSVLNDKNMWNSQLPHFLMYILQSISIL